MIPSAYKKVSYLKSNGNQYVQTNIVPNANQIYEATAQFLYLANDYFFSTEETVGNEQRDFSCRLSASSKALTFFLATASTSVSASSGDQLDKKSIKLDLVGKKAYWGSRNKALSTSIDYAKLPTTPITIFKDINLNSSGRLILYDFEITENNTVTHTLTPVVRKEDEKTGLYDEIEQVFYPNLGSEEFITDYVPDGQESSVNCYLGSTKISKVMLGSTEIQNIL